MERNKEGFIEFETKKDVEQFTDQHKKYLDKLSTDDDNTKPNMQKYKIENLQKASRKNDLIKKELGFNEDDDMVKISYQAAIYKFFRRYCGNVSIDINECLRQDMKPKMEEKLISLKFQVLKDNGGDVCDIVDLSPEESIKLIKDEFCKFSTEDDLVVWRGIRSNRNFNPFNSWFICGEYKEKGFSSCGSILDELLKTEKVINSDIIMKIKVPKGSPVIYMGYISGNESELEWLLPPGTTIKQTSLERSKEDGKTIIECEAIFDDKLIERQHAFQNALQNKNSERMIDNNSNNLNDLDDMINNAKKLQCDSNQKLNKNKELECFNEI